MPDSFAVQLIARLQLNPDSPAAEGLGLLAGMSSSDQARRWLRELMAGWEVAGISAGAVAFALTTARLMRLRSSSTAELLWTGPTASDVPLRRTDQVLLQLIDGAKLELLIVSFVAYAETRCVTG